MAKPAAASRGISARNIKLENDMEITAQIVRNLIDAQFPQWSGLEIRPVQPGGHDNRTFRLGGAMTVRLPCGPAYAAQVEKEAKWLPVLAKGLSLPIPSPIAMGAPTGEYPFPWSVNRYIEGETVRDVKNPDADGLARDLSAFLKELQGIGTAGAPAAGPHNFFRGASPAVYSGEVEAALQRHRDSLPAERLRDVWERAAAASWNRPPVWVHGDVAPGNLLIRDGSLCGVIDFGIMGIGDPACDYAMAWSFFDRGGRSLFLQGLDGGTVCRARGWALWKALITLDLPGMASCAEQTLQAILDECGSAGAPAAAGQGR